jgi:sulfur dioxygenase
LRNGDRIRFGFHELEARATPGHTDGCITYVLDGGVMAFTGDTLLIRGCGRTDFQQGDPHVLFKSVRERIFNLPDECLLYPGHDYKGRMVTSVAEEKRYNARLGLAKSEQEFVEIMNGLQLAYPKRIDEAVPANLESGMIQPEAPTLPSVAGVIEKLGRQDAELWQGMGI